ncbi:exopolysaccharide biosynthesis GT4 family glycosyltransferase EpsE [Cognatishimia activa]|uniref:GDP-mannose-dependent alpha-(1-6)-phosphatidylinositol monomannoside mannosyltransferase n=1 Tax=Cognatishimia activa TaxID=1715691 RepID=A0A0P1IMR2_9RHOB|nr:exopolysaccharide biosynthesis GT4 family glycosyltransferase EpsE [Cognatishimia activa]CUJ12954.1 GDP-mannose-dependent alpha-(1-6)-phosphatidylinositol monomannoside mannosyltransferase [Cognatishimia activa]CUK24946.1 GDP-mannose-dependent alpha-(1-6)-phosphatidylinositol monomannoside mannosyltransferase [Cognatishimia activa]
MTQSPKIGYLIPEFPGQTHIFFWREILALERMGIEVVLFSTRRPPPGLISHKWSVEAIARTEYLGVVDGAAAARTALSVSPTVYAKDVLREGKTLGKDLAVTTGAAQLLKKSCAQHGVSHVHVHSCGRAALVAMLANRMGGPSYSVTLHGPMSDYGVGQKLKWRHAKFATVITEKLNALLPEQLGDDLPEKVFIQPMGVDVSVLSRDGVPYMPYHSGGPLQLFSCGRLNIVKGHQDLIDAVKQLRDQGIDARLNIAGEDDDGGHGYRRVLEEKIADLDIGTSVKLLGAISAEDVRRHLLEAHIFALASWHEPLGVAYMEAMACEVPTIGTDAGGVPELIRHGVDGVMTKPKSPTDLAAAIQLLSNNAEDAMRLGKAGRARVLDRFDCKKGAELIARESLDLTISKQI